MRQNDRMMAPYGVRFLVGCLDQLSSHAPGIRVMFGAASFRILRANVYLQGVVGRSLRPYDGD